MEATRESIHSGYSGEEIYAILAALGTLVAILSVLWSTPSKPSPTVFALKRGIACFPFFMSV